MRFFHYLRVRARKRRQSRRRRQTSTCLCDRASSCREESIFIKTNIIIAINNIVDINTIIDINILPIYRTQPQPVRRKTDGNGVNSARLTRGSKTRSLVCVSAPSLAFVSHPPRVGFFFRSWSNQQIAERCWQAIAAGGRTKGGPGKTSNNSITRRRSVTLPARASKCERNFVKALLS